VVHEYLQDAVVGGSDKDLVGSLLLHPLEGFGYQPSERFFLLNYNQLNFRSMPLRRAKKIY
jgi:hypothetical protein